MTSGFPLEAYICRASSAAVLPEPLGPVMTVMGRSPDIFISRIPRKLDMCSSQMLTFSPPISSWAGSR